MSEPPTSQPHGALEPGDAAGPGPRAGDGDEGRYLPVPADPARRRGVEIAAVEARPVERPAASDLPDPLTVAAGGFLAGFATVTLGRVLRGRTPWGLLRRVRRRRALER